MKSYLCRVRLIERTVQRKVEAPDIRKAAIQVRFFYPDHLGFRIEEAWP